ncbi:hypothetical protein ACGFMO_07695 [Streptomyces niveus]|uniref:hypothetical protein n=1 Tax=Streptomyces niveus TaxID=193462 RepID=UPI0037128931
MKMNSVRSTIGKEALTVDLAIIGDTVNTALAIVLLMPDRSQIDATSRALISHLEGLLLEDLGFDNDQKVREMYREAYRYLEFGRRPGADTTQFHAYEYMRGLAQLTRRFASVYAESRDADDKCEQ